MARAASSSRTLADYLAAGHALPRATWGTVDPRPRVVPPEKGRGAYRRQPRRRQDSARRNSAD